jgi:general secretion pathway protein E
MVYEASRTQGFDEFLAFLEARRLLTPEAARRARAAQATTRHPADTVLVELGLMREADLAAQLAAFLGLPELRLTPEAVDRALVEQIGLGFVESNQVLPLALTDTEVIVAVADPFARTAVELISYQVDLPAALRICPRSAIVETARALAETRPAAAPVEARAGDAGHDDDIERLRDVAREAPIIRFVAQVIQAAVDRGATDIHIEPGLDHIRIRLRCDGMLELVDTAPRAMHAGIATRIKILSRLNIAERRLPQDGRMRVSVRGQEIDLRVSVLPSVHGETFVLRILDKSGVTLSLDALGYGPEAIAQLRALARVPNGIVLLTGPTGSGKTTTLYSVLRERTDDEVKIFTVEDPVEYRLDGISQLQIDPGIELTFARALRSVLRHDPDIILIGEIRDRETAQIAIQAALTGHLVFSTLHTNSAAGALTRLLDMGIDGYLIGATVRAVAAQRLLRKLCTSCGGAGVEACPDCHGSGYAGRTVTYEILEITRELAALISAGATEAALQARALDQGLRPMARHAAALVAAGATSLEEVGRVLETGLGPDDDLDG